MSATRALQVVDWLELFFGAARPSDPLRPQVRPMLVPLMDGSLILAVVFWFDELVDAGADANDDDLLLAKNVLNFLTVVRNGLAQGCSLQEINEYLEDGFKEGWPLFAIRFLDWVNQCTEKPQRKFAYVCVANCRDV